MAKKPVGHDAFQDLLGKLVHVPKAELEKELKADKRRRKRRRKGK